MTSKIYKSLPLLAALGLGITMMGCDDKGLTPPDFPAEEEQPSDSSFYFGADLSNVNNILDHDGTYQEDGVTNPYQIFADHGSNLVRLRIWHNPTWTEEAYGTEGNQMYNDLYDVEKSISEAKAQGMKVLLDFHYGDSWADPGKQPIPAAWADITDIDVLADSVYNYTYQTLTYLSGKGLIPEMVQIGNETNCGMLFTDAASGFPSGNACDDGSWVNLGKIMNAGIEATREVENEAGLAIKIAVHVADPKNINSFTNSIINTAGVTDFDIIGFSYYPLWHTTVALDDLSNVISNARDVYNKEIMMVETAYPWTTDYDDVYNNSFGSETAVDGYPYSETGQYDLLVKLTQEVKDGGGIGIIYWEPAWISSNMKDLWGTGSSWENAALFDFDGNPVRGMTYMEASYQE